MHKKSLFFYVKIGLIFIVFTLLYAIFISSKLCFPGLCYSPSYFKKVQDKHIIQSIKQIQRIMPYLGDYVDCGYEQIKFMCQDIDENYGLVDGREPIIVRNTSSNSHTVCIYSPLNEKEGWFRKENLWFCADNSGRIGYTLTDPGKPEYCVEGESTICPPVFQDVEQIL